MWLIYKTTMCNLYSFHSEKCWLMPFDVLSYRQGKGKFPRQNKTSWCWLFNIIKRVLFNAIYDSESVYKYSRTGGESNGSGIKWVTAVCWGSQYKLRSECDDDNTHTVIIGTHNKGFWPYKLRVKQLQWHQENLIAIGKSQISAKAFILYMAFKVNTGKVIEMYSLRHSKRQFFW